MMYGQSTETLAGKTSGSRNRHCDFGVPYQACCMLLCASITGFSNYCYNSCNRDIGLPDMEAKARFQLVEKESVYG